MFRFRYGHTFSHNPQSIHLLLSTFGNLNPSADSTMLIHCFGHAFAHVPQPQHFASDLICIIFSNYFQYSSLDWIPFSFQPYIPYLVAFICIHKNGMKKSLFPIVFPKIISVESKLWRMLKNRLQTLFQRTFFTNDRLFNCLKYPLCLCSIDKHERYTLVVIKLWMGFLYTPKVANGKVTTPFYRSIRTIGTWQS